MMVCLRIGTLLNMSVLKSRTIPCSVVRFTSRDTSLKLMEELAIKQNAQQSTKTSNHPIKFIQVLGSGVPGAGRSLQVQLGKGSILFNCGEMTPYIGKNFSHIFRGLRTIFLTHGSWENIAGLPSFKFIFNLQEKSLIAYGSSQLEKMWPSINSLDSTRVNLKIMEKPDNSEFDLGDGLTMKTFHIESKKHDRSYAYALSSSFIPGKFSVDKLLSLPTAVSNINKLKNGESITLEDGTKVHPDDVKTKGIPPVTILILEAPTLSHLDSLITHEGLESYQLESNKPNPALVVHFSKQEVIDHPKYQEFIDKFPPSTYHLVLNDCNKCTAITQNFDYLKLQRLLWPNVFPVLHMENMEPSEQDLSPGTLIYGATNLKFDPNKLRFYSGNCIVNKKDLNLEKFLLDAEAEMIYEKHLEALSNLPPRENANPHPNVVFLGTASAVSCPDRGVSGILVNISEHEHVLFDCGLGSFLQLVKFHGVEKAKQTAMDTSMVFLSHFHLDHHFGVITFLLERQNAFKQSNKEVKPCYILADKYVEAYLRKFASNFQPLENVHFVKNSDLVDNKQSDMMDRFHKSMNSVGLCVELCKVPHTKFSCGIAISHENGWKIVYSGDTLPSNEFVEFGMNCDLLIHEATFEEDMKPLAHKRHHSTISQAMRIGKRMKAKKTILTHFSLRYKRLPYIPRNLAPCVGIAYDFAQFDLNEDPQMFLFYPTLKNILFTEFIERENFSRNMKSQLNSRGLYFFIVYPCIVFWEHSIIVYKPLI